MQKIWIKYKRIILICITVIALLGVIFLYNNQSKIVNVKYGDMVNIAHWESVNTTKSSFVNGAWYNQKNSKMIIKLSENYYQYCNVPSNIWKEFKSADSFGSYYNTNIKDSYNCKEKNTSTESKNDFVFDHTIPLALGGSDFSATSIATFKEEIKKMPNYNESYLNCFYEAIKEEPKILTSVSYIRQSDGSWMNEEGNYPSIDLENSIEIQVTDLFKNCINSIN